MDIGSVIDSGINDAIAQGGGRHKPIASYAVILDNEWSTHGTKGIHATRSSVIKLSSVSHLGTP